MGLVGIIVLIVLASGCISSSTNKTKTFSDGAMSFNYPADFNNTTYSENDTNSSSPMQVIGEFESTVPFKYQYIMVGKNISAISPTELRNWSVSNLKNSSTGELISITTETNPNGVVIQKTTYTEEFMFGIRTRFNDMYFKINDTVYAISVYGPDININKQNITETTNIIFKSIK